MKTDFFKYFNINKYVFYFLPLFCFSVLKNVSEKRMVIYLQFAFLFIECGVEFYIEDMQNDDDE